MSQLRGMIDLGTRTLLEFRGPDAVRFLNGQVTQDVTRVVDRMTSLPSCVTDAKGRLQFRVTITCGPEGGLWVTGPAEWAETLEARLTRYLIADDVEVCDRSSHYSLVHFPDMKVEFPSGSVLRESNRFGVPGMDRWVPTGQLLDGPVMADDAVEDLRIAHGVPRWGFELRVGMLPPEALLDVTDISYHKGCYVGQEVISRIKSAGKVNKRLTRFSLDEKLVISPCLLENGAGEITSVSPLAHEGVRYALGFVKRGATELYVKAADGVAHPLVVR